MVFHRIGWSSGFGTSLLFSSGCHCDYNVAGVCYSSWLVKLIVFVVYEWYAASPLSIFQPDQPHSRLLVLFLPTVRVRILKFIRLKVVLSPSPWCCSYVLIFYPSLYSAPKSISVNFNTLSIAWSHFIDSEYLSEDTHFRFLATRYREAGLGCEPILLSSCLLSLLLARVHRKISIVIKMQQ